MAKLQKPELNGHVNHTVQGSSMQNLVSIFSPKLHGMFFTILASLALFDSFYIVLSLAEALRGELGHYNLLVYIVRYVTYPLQNIILCITIFLPVALSIERYRAIR